MGMLSNRQAESNGGTAPTTKTPKPRGKRYTLGNSGAYAEPAAYLQAELDARVQDIADTDAPSVEAILVRLLTENNAASIEVCEGKSLKIMLNTGAEVKFMGFITAGDGSVSLDDEDTPTIKDAITTHGIVEAISAKALVAML